jgi:hypothetical protein
VDTGFDVWWESHGGEKEDRHPQCIIARAAWDAATERAAKIADENARQQTTLARAAKRVGGRGVAALKHAATIAESISAEIRRGQP